MTDADRASYLRARELLDPVGVPIELAAAQVADAKRRLGGVSVETAVDYYEKRFRPREPGKSTREIIDELLEEKKCDGLSEIYIEALDIVLTKFANKFRGKLRDVSGVAVDSWLRRSMQSARTRNNVRAGILTLVNFAKRKRYLPENWDELDAIPVLKEPPHEIQIFTPTELMELLKFSHEKLVPFFTIAAFAGVRHAEIKRLDWKDVWLDKGYLLVGATKAKPSSRRLVPVSKNLSQWLAKYHKEHGPVCEFIKTPNRIHDVVVKINKARRRRASEDANAGARNVEESASQFQLFTWKKNVLRHSFISYRLAQTQNVDQVALEAGSSRQMIFTYYRELVTADSASEWFGISPTRVSKLDL